MMSLLATIALLPFVQGPIKTEVVKTSAGYEIRRAGKPFFIKGAGGTTKLGLLKQSGANSIRTWGAENGLKDLDEAHKNGLTMTLGIWLGHKSYFDYKNAEQVQKQKEDVRAAVEKHKNHPALLMWGLGNEMEIDNDTPELWKAIDDLAKLCKQLDPNHPTMTVVAEITEQKLRNIRQYAPNIDVLAVNTYGGMPSLGTRLRANGWDKPFLVSEFGPLGPWEVGRSPWAAPLENTSTEKATWYRRGYEGTVRGSAGQCLGSYVFLWGDKQEVTPTWFGMFLPETGEQLETVDLMTFLWTGQWPKLRAPQITGFILDMEQQTVPAGSPLNAWVTATDPNGDKLKSKWVIKPEVDGEKYAGEGENRPKPLVTVAEGTDLDRISFKAPTAPGKYRLYLYVYDGTGRAATANAVFQVK